MNDNDLTARLRADVPVLEPDAAFVDRLAAVAGVGATTAARTTRAGGRALRVALAAMAALLLAAGGAFAARSLNQGHEPAPAPPATTPAPTPTDDPAGEDTTEDPGDQGAPQTGHQEETEHGDRAHDEDENGQDDHGDDEPGDDEAGSDQGDDDGDRAHQSEPDGVASPDAGDTDQSISGTAEDPEGAGDGSLTSSD